MFISIVGSLKVVNFNDEVNLLLGEKLSVVVMFLKSTATICF